MWESKKVNTHTKLFLVHCLSCIFSFIKKALSWALDTNYFPKVSYDYTLSPSNSFKYAKHPSQKRDGPTNGLYALIPFLTQFGIQATFRACAYMCCGCRFLSPLLLGIVMSRSALGKVRGEWDVFVLCASVSASCIRNRTFGHEGDNLSDSVVLYNASAAFF